jgi:hypothetical protein
VLQPLLQPSAPPAPSGQGSWFPPPQQQPQQLLLLPEPQKQWTQNAAQVKQQPWVQQQNSSDSN